MWCDMGGGRVPTDDVNDDGEINTLDLIPKLQGEIFYGVDDCSDHGYRYYDWVIGGDGSGFAADGSCFDNRDGTSVRFYCMGPGPCYFCATVEDTSSCLSQCDHGGDHLYCDPARYSFEGAAELACSDWLGVGHTCETTWTEVCDGDHPLGAQYNDFPIGMSGCTQCSDYCPITRERCEVLADLGADLPDNCNCGDCGFPACGDCDCDHYGDEHCCTNSDDHDH